MIRRFAREHPLLAAIGLLALAWLVISFVPPWADERVNDFYVYRMDGTAFLHGFPPYRDVLFEYPPLVAPLLALPALGGDVHEVYRVLFSAMMLGLAVPTLMLTRRLAALTGGNARVAAFAFALSPLLLGATVRDHFDLAPVALMLGALVLLLRDRVTLGFAVLGLAAMAKGFPLVAAPIALAWLLARGERRAALRGLVALTAVVAALVGVAVALSPKGALQAIQYHQDRPVQIESTPASVLFATEALGGAPTLIVESYRSNGVLHPSADAMTGLFAGLGMAVMALLVWRVVARPGPRELVLASLAAAAAFACFGKVLSPQYLIWTLPLLALALAWRRRALAVAVGAATVLTFVEFPFQFVDLVNHGSFPIVVVALRNVALIASVAIAVLELSPLPAREKAPAEAALDRV
ncbi:MAG: hypothetical protein QOE08_711 [Thermoleophilaceae bacterium]|nr:hypothetical protein [Thermoleophilaceae bacterium]